MENSSWVISSPTLWIRLLLLAAGGQPSWQQYFHSCVFKIRGVLGGEKWSDREPSTPQYSLVNNAHMSVAAVLRNQPQPRSYFLAFVYFWIRFSPLAHKKYLQLYPSFSISYIISVLWLSWKPLIGGLCVWTETRCPVSGEWGLGMLSNLFRSYQL